MKALILALSLSPLAAQAATDLTCESEGTGGALSIHVIAEEGLDRTGAHVRIEAQGILHTEFTAVVDRADPQGTQLVSDLSHLVQTGVEDPEGGAATLTIATEAFYDQNLPTGAGSIAITKRPKTRGPLRLLGRYELSNCKGSI